jgi:hypothetical protein
MKITETFISHTGLIDVGRFGLFIIVSKDGVNIPDDELIKQALFFPRVILQGEPFDQREETTKFCKQLLKQNDKIKIEINTNGIIKPLSIPNLDNITFNVHLQLKISGLSSSRRIKPNVINWFNQIGANFVFDINIEDEVDETNLLVQENNIKKRDVYLSLKNYEQFDNVRVWAKNNGYNFAPDFKSLLWNKDGRK